MKRLLVLSEHPSLMRGFATVGHRVADQLQRTGRWQVDYLGRFAPGENGGRFSYRVIAPHGPNAPHGASDAPPLDEDPQLEDALSELVTGVAREELPVPLLFIGTGADLSILLEIVDRPRVRDRLRIASYVPIDFVPCPPAAAELARRVDAFTPFTRFARTAVESCCEDAGLTNVNLTDPIPHGVDCRIFQPAGCEERTRIRRELFGVDDESLLVAYFGRNSGHKRPDLVLRIFSHFALGTYLRCERCQRLTAFEPHPVDLTPCQASACRHCSCEDTKRALPRPKARLYMHTELLRRAERMVSGGWDLEQLVQRYGIADQVQFEHSLTIGRGIPVQELALRMGACDIHLLPYDCGGWELTVLETGACGVPNIITDYAAPPEYAAPFSEVVPVGSHLFDVLGVRAVIDVDLALAALVRLAGSPGRRRRMGERGIEVARAHSWDRIGRSWDELLNRLCERQ